MLYFDLLCGASGDMILASLVDLGVPLSFLNDRFQTLKIPGLGIEQTRQVRAGKSCTQLLIHWSQESQREYRNLYGILTLLQRGSFPPRAVEICRRILERLAKAESRVHGVPVDQVHFHEIGAVDTVVDVLGFALSVEYLRIETILFSTLTVGTGIVDTAHRTLTVPAPATQEMLAGLEVRQLATGTEILTPTGCAILTACGRQSSNKPGGAIAGEGFGCGQKHITGFSDFLRVVQLSTEPST
jgi:uncharacterized protein (DUF111 family)